jgi:hypothetical protein
MRITYEERPKQEINIKIISSPALDLTESNSVQLCNNIYKTAVSILSYGQIIKYISEMPAAKVPLMRDIEALNTELEIE